MANVITEARDELLTSLEPLETLGVRIYAAYPDTVQPPAIVVEPDEPYMTLGATYGGSYDIHMQLIVLVFRAGKLSALDDLLVDLLQVKSGWRLKDVAALPTSEPGRPDLLSTVVKVSKTVYI